MSAPAAAGAIPVIEVIAGWPDRGGGISQYMRYVLEENVREGLLEVRAVLDPRGRGKASGTLWNLPKALYLLLRARGRGTAPAVLHIHIAGRLSVLRKCAMLAWGKALGFGCVLHYHEYGFAAHLLRMPAPLRALTVAALRLADHHIVLGAIELERLPPLLRRDPARFTMVYNGVPRRALSVQRRPETGRILFLGGLSERKGVSDLLRALALLPPQAHLVLCGGGDVARYQALAAELKVSDRCSFLGLQPAERVQAELARAHVFTLPSFAEGLSIALLEAMAVGCPVVATMVGEHPHVLEPSMNALVVRPGDAEGLAQALGALMSDQALATRIGAAGQATIAARFTSDVALRKLANVLGRFSPGQR